MEKQKAICNACIVGSIGMAVLYLFFHSRPSAISASIELNDAVGKVTADETLKILRKQGSILLLAEDDSIIPNLVSDSQVASFEKEIEQKRGVKVEAMEKIKRDRLEEAQNPTSRGLSASQLMEAINAHPGVTMVVSFMGFPQLKESEVDTLKASELRCAAVFNSSEGIDFKTLSTQGIMELAIVARDQPVEPEGGKGRTTKGLFDQFYTLLKPELITSETIPMITIPHSS